jgi:signal transduction histidine kinase
VFGVLTLASSAEYDYTPQEVTAFASVAGEVGTVIANHRSFQRSALASTSYAEIGLAITGVEVAQAARHEARGLIDDCVVTMGSLALEARKLSGGRPATNVLARIDDIDATLQDLSRVLDKIKAATRAPRREKALVSLREVWDQARSQLIGKFHGARLESCRYDGPDVMVNVATDWFRQVFINLILNSLEAFAEGSSNKRGRQIRLVVERPGERQRDYVMTYSDNAGGINPSALRHLDGSTVAESVEHAIFQPNVTSKAAGSGWGLALVRRILEDHRGTINLVDYRGGVTFRLQIPRPAPSGGRDT